MSTGSTLARRTGLDPGCGHGRRYRDQEAAETARAGDEALKPLECPLRPGTWHLVPVVRVPPLARSALKPGTGKIAATRTKGTASGKPAGRNSGPTPEVRRLVLERDDRKCVRCGRSILGIRYSLGHRKRASQGGLASPSNLLTFCGLGGEMCHGAVDNRSDPHDEAKGYSLRSWQDPLAEPVMLFSEGGSGITVWLDDEGHYLTEPPEGVEAA